jgi:4-methyl-5(b-hydroxyethyl)-thiazole monophosphate biosynthesis
MNSLVLLAVADGTEDLEAVTTLDVLRRAQIQVTVASIEAEPGVTCARGTRLVADALFSDVQHQTFDLIVLPGGLAGAERLGAHQPLAEKVRRHVSDGRLYAAICAAPVLALQPFGVLRQRRVTCYPSLADRLNDCTFVDLPVVVDGTCITSQGPATAMPFALKLVETLAGKVCRDEVARALLYG